MVTACIVLLYISYSIPVICLLIRGRNNIRHGPFWLGPFGLFANIVLLLWTAFTLIMYSFPPVMPVAAGSKSDFFSFTARFFKRFRKNFEYLAARNPLVMIPAVSHLGSALPLPSPVTY